MSSVLPFECYREPLLPDNIRLFRLLPHEDETAPIQCEIFHYPLQKSGRRTHPYETLSYVWGGSDKSRSISIRERNSESGHDAMRVYDIPVTENLHAALAHLRYPFFERIIWIDAVCINQNDEREKEQQIKYMAKIYALANRVVVWLGNAAEHSDKALHWIRDAGGNSSTISTSDGTIQQAVIALLQRPWFRRIWVLQEVAAARQILIMCGNTEVDGYAFCLGMDSFDGFNKAHADLQSLTHSVTYLIRGSIFRHDFSMSESGMSFLDICPLGELVDMYHTHEATKRHDKVFALLGMSSDDLSKPKLLPDYRVPWEKLLQRLTKYILSEEIFVEAWGGEREIAVIKSKGWILGRVFLEQIDTFRDNRDGMNIIFKNKDAKTRWTIQTSAKPVRDGDLICLLQGASRPTIIRQRQDRFDIVMIGARPPERVSVGHEYVEWPDFLQSRLLLIHDFVLIWNWEVSVERFQDPEGYDLMSESSVEFASSLNKATRIWDIALVLEDLEEYEEAAEKTKEAIKVFETEFGLEHPYTLKRPYGLTPLSWAAENGQVSVASSLLAKAGIDPDWKDSELCHTPLLRAAKGGHEAVVELFINTGKVDVDSKDISDRTPLSWAAEGGYEAVVKLLLETGKVEVDSKDMWYSRTPLSWGAERGHETVVKLLLETGKVEVDSRDKSRSTPLLWAAERGHEAIVKLLLETGKVEVDSKDNAGRTPLSWAAEGGHEAVVKLLLEKSKDELDVYDWTGRTPLSLAAEKGHGTTVKLLLETGKFDIDSVDRQGRTPLFWAAMEGHEAIVTLLLEKSKVELDLHDWGGQTPLSWAAERGHEAVVKLLLETGKVEVDSKDNAGRTPLSWAVKGGHEAIVKLLLEIGKVDVNLADKHGQTPLSRAAEERHENIVKLLQSSTK